MYRKLKVLAVIPARGGSKGIPRKNLVSIGKRPLISYSIAAAKRSKLVDRFVVSSEDDEILSVSRRYGAEVLRRPAFLARDTSAMASVLRHAITEMKKSGFHPDIVVVLQPTSPFRAVRTIDDSIRAFVGQSKRYEALTAVCRCTPKIGRILRGRYISAVAMGKQRQEVTSLYKECGTVFAFKASRILRRLPLFKGRIMPFIISDEKEALDIDSLHDLALAHCFSNTKRSGRHE